MIQDASRSAAKHHEDSENSRQKFNWDVESVYHANPCNPFEMACLITLNYSAPFPHSMSDQLKQFLSTGEREVR